MAEQLTQFLIEKNEPMQTEPISLSSNGDTAPEHPISREHSIEDNNTYVQTLSQFVVHPNEPTDDAEVLISSHDVEMTHLSSSTTINSEPPFTKNIQNVLTAPKNHSP